jgi:hypothetical protein
MNTKWNQIDAVYAAFEAVKATEVDYTYYGKLSDQTA